MTASDPRSPATVRSAGQEPPLLPPAVRQALEHPGPFALGLDAWLAAECGATHPEELAAAVRARQLELLNADLCHMAKHSSLYRQRLMGAGRWSAAGLRPLRDLSELAELPFTTADDLRPGEALLCVSRDEVARMVTVSTSGSTGAPKRLAFSDAELARTRDFFAVGMAQMVTAGQHVAVLLPGAHRPRGITDLLAGSLAPQGVRVTACMELADLLLCVPEQAPEGAAARLAAVRAALHRHDDGAFVLRHRAQRPWRPPVWGSCSCPARWNAFGVPFPRRRRACAPLCAPPTGWIPACAVRWSRAGSALCWIITAPRRAPLPGPCSAAAVKGGMCGPWTCCWR